MRNHLKTFVLLAGLTGILISVGALIGQGALIAFTVLALALNLGMYFFSDRIVLKMHRAVEVGPLEAPALHRMVESLSVAANIPKPRIFIIPSDQPNAFATGRSPKHGAVAVTRGIQDLLTERELRGVLAHELAHIRNRDTLVCTIAAGIAGAIAWIGNMLQFSAIFGGSDEEGDSPLGALAMAIVAPIAATLVQLAVSRSREFLADHTGAKLSGDPEALARALEKLERGAALARPATPTPATASLFIVNPFSARDGLVSLFSTHPATRERVRRLRALLRYPEDLAA